MDHDEFLNEKFKMGLTDPDSFLGDYSSMRRGMSFVSIKRQRQEMKNKLKEKINSKDNQDEKFNNDIQTRAKSEVDNHFLFNKNEKQAKID